MFNFWFPKKSDGKSEKLAHDFDQKTTKWDNKLFKSVTIFCGIVVASGVSLWFINYFFLEVHIDPKEQAKLREQVALLKQNAIPLTSVKPVKGVKLETTDLADLQVLKPILQDKKMVGLGEATHGTKEFFIMKHRLFQFLVSELGFRVFAIEYHFSDSIAINNYVLKGEGNAEEVVKNIKYWTWRTQEVLDLVKWMREWNTVNPNDPVKFYGFDMQGYEEPIIELKKYAIKTKFLPTENLERTRFMFEILQDKFDVFSQKHQTQNEKESTLNLVKEIQRVLDNKKSQLISQTSQREWAEAKQHARILEQYYSQVTSSDVAVMSNVRDRAMAENVQHISEFERHSKIVLWAHNGHVSKAANRGIGISLGKHLKGKYNQQYYSLGFEFYQGCFQARRVGMADILPVLSSLFATQKAPLEELCITDSPLEETLAYKLGRIGEPYLFLDFNRKNFYKSKSNWLREPLLYHDIGSSYPSHKLAAVMFLYDEGILPELYDGLIYIHNTTRAEPLQIQN